MATTADFDALRTELRRALRYGARATALLRRPGLVDLLCPASPGGEPLVDRAIRASDVIAATVGGLDIPIDIVVGILLCLRPGTAGTTLTARRASAAEVVDVEPETFRTEPRHEQTYVDELALALYRLGPTA